MRVPAPHLLRVRAYICIYPHSLTEAPPKTFVEESATWKDTHTRQRQCCGTVAHLRWVCRREYFFARCARTVAPRGTLLDLSCLISGYLFYSRDLS